MVMVVAMRWWEEKPGLDKGVLLLVAKQAGKPLLPVLGGT